MRSGDIMSDDKSRTDIYDLEAFKKDILSMSEKATGLEKVYKRMRAVLVRENIGQDYYQNLFQVQKGMEKISIDLLEISEAVSEYIGIEDEFPWD